MKKLTLQEYIREKNLCIILEQECTNEFVVKIDAFFDDLFSGLKMCTKDGKPDLIFMKEGKFVMIQDLENCYLWCKHYGFWEVLEYSFLLEYKEIHDFIQYIVEETFKMGSLTPYYEKQSFSN